ncbi:unnamed protein product, partial [Mesorhabditis spiculigera]
MSARAPVLLLLACLLGLYLHAVDAECYQCLQADPITQALLSKHPVMSEMLIGARSHASCDHAKEEWEICPRTECFHFIMEVHEQGLIYQADVRNCVPKDFLKHLEHLEGEDPEFSGTGSTMHKKNGSLEFWAIACNDPLCNGQPANEMKQQAVNGAGQPALLLALFALVIPHIFAQF